MKDIEDENINIASATECTGLIPTLPKDGEEEANYKSLISPLPKKKRK